MAEAGPAGLPDVAPPWSCGATGTKAPASAVTAAAALFIASFSRCSIWACRASSFSFRAAFSVTSLCFS